MSGQSVLSFKPLAVQARSNSSIAPGKSADATLSPATPLAQSDLESNIEATLSNVFHHSVFRGNQREIIVSALRGRDSFIVMPTGAGKSLCFQLPGVILSGLTLVVSPLIALMQDQVHVLKQKNIPAECYNSSLTEKERQRIIKEITSTNQTIKLLYVTPEMISTPSFLRILESLHGRSLLSLFVVDESHCISKWGVGFRPDYRKLSILKQKFPRIPVMALTATATKQCVNVLDLFPVIVQDDVVTSLQLHNPQLFIASFNRPNISYEVRFKDLLPDVYEDLSAFVGANLQGMSGIVYCHKRTDCDQVAQTLKYKGINAVSYHAGLPTKERENVLIDFLGGKIAVAVATIAFGMGIDKQNVRFVAHFTLPKSIEEFYQESGRAGRDGLPAKSLVYYSEADRSLFEFLLKKTSPNVSDEENQRRVQLKMNAFSVLALFLTRVGVVEYCTEATCRRKRLLRYFGEPHPGVDICKKTCDVCVDGGRRARRMIEELHEPKPLSSSSSTFSRSYHIQEAHDMFDDYAYDSKHNRAATDALPESHHTPSGFVAASTLLSGQGVEAPKFNPNGDNSAFFSAYKNAEKRSVSSNKTLGARRSVLQDSSKSIRSGFTNPAKKANKRAVIDLIDDDDGALREPGAKKRRTSGNNARASNGSAPVPSVASFAPTEAFDSLFSAPSSRSLAQSSRSRRIGHGAESVIELSDDSPVKHLK